MNKLLNINLEKIINENYANKLKELKLLDELYMLSSEYSDLRSLKVDLLAETLLNYDIVLYTILNNEYCTSPLEWNNLNIDGKHSLMEEIEQFLYDEILNIVEQ